MPRYQLKYRIKTPLNNRRDIVLSYGRYDVCFLFANKQADDRDVFTTVEIEAENNLQAHMLAMGHIIPHVLDAFSFTARSPMLLGEREMTLKAEQGQETRRGFCVLERKNAQPAPLDEEAADRAQHILQSQNGPTLPLCWQRYAIDRSLVLETFIFQWLAFEGLAGTT